MYRGTRERKTTMKAIYFEAFGGREVLQVGEVPAPRPRKTELLIEVRRSSVNYVDIRERQGTYNRPETHVGGIDLPRISGLQAVGFVVDSGSAGDRSWIGRKVLAYTPHGGAYAQFVTAEIDLCIEIPDTNEDLYAALPTQGLTAYLTLTSSSRLQSGESVLVQGASGGVGSLAVQIAKILGAGPVFGTASTQEKLSFIRSLGADAAIDYTREDWPQLVLQNTGGRGVDVLLESVGGDIFEKNFECLATFGRYVVFGSTRGPGQPIAPRRLMQKCQTLTGFYVPVFLSRPDLLHAGLEFLVDATRTGKLRPSIARTLPLREAAEGQRLLEAREATGIITLDATSNGW
jgi:NADPH2:quinone reductase